MQVSLSVLPTISGASLKNDHNFSNSSMKQLGGGTVLDIGIYCVQFASFAFGGAKPTKILAGGHLNQDGIDESSSATLLYTNGRTAPINIGALAICWHSTG